MRRGFLVAVAIVGLASCAVIYLALSRSAEQQSTGIPPPKRTGTPSRYEIVFVIDTTKSMQLALAPIKDAVSQFVARVETDIGKANDVDGTVVRMGLLFFQDRKIGGECRLDYVTEWRVRLTAASGPETLRQTLDELAGVKPTKCGSDEEEEAVFDAINRAIIDPHWLDGSMRSIILIGDAAPHPPTDERKNPLHLDVKALQLLADERNIRLLTIQIKRYPYQDVSAFTQLATDRPEQLRGRFEAASMEPTAIRECVQSVLWTDWTQTVRPALALSRRERATEPPPNQ